MSLRDQLDGLPPWMTDAACLNHPRADLWFRNGAEAAPAKLVCAGCPVRVPCLEHAITQNEQHGIWGGRDQKELNAIRRQLRRRLRRG